MPQSVSSTTSEGNSKDFIVFLTVEGTDYQNIECIISNPYLPIKDLIERIVKKLALPKIDNGGNPIQYLLCQHLNDDNEPEILEFEDEEGTEQALVDYNIKPGDQLILTDLPIAGGAIGSSCNYYAPSPKNCAPTEKCSNSEIGHPAPCAVRPSARPKYEFALDRASSDEEETVVDCAPAYDEEPSYLTSAKPKKDSIWKKLFGKLRKSADVNASAYAPAKVVPYEDFIVRVFVHIPEEIDNINSLIKEIDRSSVKKANKPLDLSVNDGDKITVNLIMPENISTDCNIQTAHWHGKSLEFDFGCLLTDEFASSRLCRAIIAVNDVPAGELKFIIKVVYETPEVRTTSVDAHKFSKIFISYSHADYKIVRGIAEGCKINASDYFFDRHSLKGGDIFKEKILDYISRADLFVLCWSENAANSKWVKLEMEHAMERIEKGSQTLSIYPICVPPPAPLPSLLSDKYNFVNLM